MRTAQTHRWQYISVALPNQLGKPAASEVKAYRRPFSRVKARLLSLSRISCKSVIAVAVKCLFGPITVTKIQPPCPLDKGAIGVTNLPLALDKACKHKEKKTNRHLGGDLETAPESPFLFFANQLA